MRTGALGPTSNDMLLLRTSKVHHVTTKVQMETISGGPNDYLSQGSRQQIRGRLWKKCSRELVGCLFDTDSFEKLLFLRCPNGSFCFDALDDMAHGLHLSDAGTMCKVPELCFFIPYLERLPVLCF